MLLVYLCTSAGFGLGAGVVSAVVMASLNWCACVYVLRETKKKLYQCNQHTSPSPLISPAVQLPCF